MKSSARFVVIVSQGGYGCRYAAAEVDRLGPILRAGPFWTLPRTQAAIRQLKLERRRRARKR